MSASRIAINVLGAPTLVADGGAVPLSPGAATLCAYLALAPREGRPRALAAAHLFGDCLEPSARRRLNTALWRLRREARARLGIELVDPAATSGLALNPALDVEVDASRFEEAVAPVLRENAVTMSPAAAARLEDAVALHRGRLMEPCTDEWVNDPRERIDRLHLGALDHLVQYHGSRGAVEPVARYGERALALAPLREDLHRHLMLAWATAGRPDLVERQFAQCRSVLLEELGADPLPETAALYDRLTHGEGGGSSVAGLVAELERARREVARLAGIVDRALERLRRMP